MKCLFCDTILKYDSSDKFINKVFRCMHDKIRVIYYVYDNSHNIEEYYFITPYQGKKFYLEWYEDSFQLWAGSNLDDLIIELDYLPKITPENAVKFIEKVLSMKAFS